MMMRNDAVTLQLSSYCSCKRLFVQLIIIDRHKPHWWISSESNSCRSCRCKQRHFLASRPRSYVWWVLNFAPAHLNICICRITLLSVIINSKKYQALGWPADARRSRYSCCATQAAGSSACDFLRWVDLDRLLKLESFCSHYGLHSQPSFISHSSKRSRCLQHESQPLHMLQLDVIIVVTTKAVTWG